MSLKALPLLLLLAGCSAPVSAEEDVETTEQAVTTPCENDGALDRCYGYITLNNGQILLYYRNYALGTANSAVTHAIVVVHGVDRNANVYFDVMADAAKARGRLGNTIIIAPLFSDQAAYNMPLYTGGGWDKGDKSSNDPRISSFEVMDTIVERLMDRAKFPSLSRITIAGHSAGGQFTQHYALATPGKAFNMRYVVANPSTFTYLDTRRYDATINGFRTLSSYCAGYNDWDYGLADLNSYAYANRSNMIDRYLDRDVWYLSGTDDTSTAGAFDDSCQATLQGPNRHERAKIYVSYLNTVWASHGGNQHVRYVGGAGHSAREMFTSGTAVEALFP